MPFTYPLDLPSADWLTRMYTQPHPAYPNGIFVSRSFFNWSLSAWTPFTIGVAYLIGVKTSNAILKRRVAYNKAGKGPVPKDYIKSSKTLSWMVLAHNAFLAIYSAWTLVHAVSELVPYFYRGLREGGVEGISNAFCTVPTHDATGLGRYIWLFYMSKYYEIVDSIILIAKGKRVSNLQSYHHTGAIASMWAGCRYSASALWIFLCFNSAIHALMYSYYTCSTLKLGFAGALKKSMTTAQITQLIVGCFVASMYLWVQYTPAAYAAGALPSVGDLETALSSSAWYRALRDAVADISGLSMASFPKDFNSTMSSASSNSATTASILRENLLHAANSNGRVTCVASTGQAFAVAFNVAYLLPLIALFLRFYFGSYKRPSTLKKD